MTGGKLIKKTCPVCEGTGWHYLVLLPFVLMIICGLGVIAWLIDGRP